MAQVGRDYVCGKCARKELSAWRANLLKERPTRTLKRPAAAEGAPGPAAPAGVELAERPASAPAARKRPAA
eukprot:10108334-Lingulodinium_polyedra.AAC.1